MSNILILPDLHEPIAHPLALEFALELKKTYKPTEVVCIGDESDQHQWHKWLKELDAPNPDRELDLTIEHLQKWYEAFPKMKLCTSNHAFRYLKRATEAGLPQRMVKNIREVFEAPKTWHWQDSWEIDGILFTHGEMSNNPIEMIKQYRKNIVMGHYHSRAGVTYLSNGLQTNWALQVGCLIDLDSYAMRYAKNNKEVGVLGAGIILDGVPHFIPLIEQ